MIGRDLGRSILNLGVVALTTAVWFVSATPARAGTATVNGFGNGTVNVQVWCFPNAPPAAPNYAAGGANFASLGPGLLGCNPATQISGATAAFWQTNWNWTSGGGDIVDDPDLLPLVTPSSPLAFGTLSVVAEILSSTSARYDITWAGSDAGVAARLTWLDGSSILDEVTRIGPWAESISVFITSSGPIESVDLRSSVIAVSLVPEPSSLALGLTGLTGAAGLALRRSRRRT